MVDIENKNEKWVYETKKSDNVILSKIKKPIFKILYKILKNDMIDKLKVKHGDQFIDGVMETFEMPTNFMSKYK